MTRAAPIALSLLFASACSTLIGIDTNLGVVPDAAIAVPEAATTDTGIEAGEDAPSEVDAPTPPPVRPPEGTYVYSAQGGDTLSGAFTVSTPYGPTATVTIAYDGPDCFKQTLQLRTDYTEMMHLCIHGLEIKEDMGTRSQKFKFGAAAQTTLTCTPGDVYFSTASKLGPWTHDCSGMNTDNQSGNSTFRTFGTYSYLTDETFTVMGRDVLTKHFEDKRAVSGSQTGSNTEEWYFSEDGILQRFHRVVDVDYAWNIYTIHYHEIADLLLTGIQGPPDAGHD
jgi:hypothetical protein